MFRKIETGLREDTAAFACEIETALRNDLPRTSVNYRNRDQIELTAQLRGAVDELDATIKRFNQASLVRITGDDIDRRAANVAAIAQLMAQKFGGLRKAKAALESSQDRIPVVVDKAAPVGKLFFGDIGAAYMRMAQDYEEAERISRRVGDALKSNRYFDSIRTRRHVFIDPLKDGLTRTAAGVTMFSDFKRNIGHILISRNPKLEFKDISCERIREYYRGDTCVLRIENPLAIFASTTGHRIVDAKGKGHYIYLSKFDSIKWEVFAGREVFEF